VQKLYHLDGTDPVGGCKRDVLYVFSAHLYIYCIKSSNKKLRHNFALFCFQTHIEGPKKGRPSFTNEPWNLSLRPNSGLACLFSQKSHKAKVPFNTLSYFWSKLALFFFNFCNTHF
jgi:hypothetical protein